MALAVAVQFLVGFAIAAPLWLGLQAHGVGPYPSAVWSAAAGYSGLWLLMKLYARLRYGRGTKVSMGEAEPITLRLLLGRRRRG